MTPTMCCGLECGRIGGSIATGLHFENPNGISPTIETTIVRSGSRSLRFAVGVSSVCTVEGVISSSSVSSIVGRCYVYFVTLPSGDADLIRWGTSSSVPKVRFHEADSSIYAHCAATAGATGVAVTTGRWYRLDFYFETSGTDTCNVQVDGVACGQASEENQTGTVTRVIMGWSSGVIADVVFDDFVWSQTPADYPIGPGYVHHFVPTSDGTHNIAGTGDFQRGNSGTDILNATTTAYQLVDDVPLPSGTVDEADNIRAVAPPNSTDYVECRFGPASGIPAMTYAPRAVEVICAYHQIGTQSGSMQVAINNSYDLLNISGQAGVTTYRYARIQGAGPSNYFPLSFFRFLSADAAPDQCLDAIMIEAEFDYVGSPKRKFVNQSVHRASAY